MSLGPFTDATDLLRFLLFASAGALLALTLGIWWGVGFVAIGTCLVLVKVREESLMTLFMRRVEYHRRVARAPRPMGTMKAGQWSDRSGVRWWFFAHTPYPISGKSVEELHQLSLRIVSWMSATSGETVLIRYASPWEVSQYLPSETKGRCPLGRDYASLLRECAESRNRAELLIGFSSNPTFLRAGLNAEGWEEFSGERLSRGMWTALPILPAGRLSLR